MSSFRRGEQKLHNDELRFSPDFSTAYLLVFSALNWTRAREEELARRRRRRRRRRRHLSILQQLCEACQPGGETAAAAATELDEKAYYKKCVVAV